MTKDKIKKAAISLFAQNGYEGGKLAEIAQAANIKTASLYFYYESKGHLFIELFDEIRDQKTKNLDKLQAEIEAMDSVKERLYHLYRYFSERNYEKNEEELFWKRCTLFPPVFLKEKINRDLIAYQSKFIAESLRPLISKGIKIGALKEQDPEIGITAFFGIVAALFNEIHYSRREAYHEKVKMLWEFYWNSLKGPDENRKARESR